MKNDDTCEIHQKGDQVAREIDDAAVGEPERLFNENQRQLNANAVMAIHE